MKKNYKIVILMTLALMLLSFNVSAQGDLYLEIERATSVGYDASDTLQGVADATSLYLSIYASGVTDLSAYGFWIDFDGDLVAFDSFQEELADIDGNVVEAQPFALQLKIDNPTTNRYEINIAARNGETITVAADEKQFLGRVKFTTDASLTAADLVEFTVTKSEYYSGSVQSYFLAPGNIHNAYINGSGATQLSPVTLNTNPNATAVASFTAPVTEGSTNTVFAFDGSASSGESITYSWDFGDASTVETTATVTHTYAAAGTYTVTLTVTDAATPPNVDTATATITVAAPAVTAAAFTVDPVSGGTIETEYTFDASTSTGDGITYEWDFGDGSTVATGVTATHTFAIDSTYTVSLTITDEVDGTDTFTADVVVAAVPVAASFTVDPTADGTTLTVYAFDATASTGTGLTYEWNFGDGSAVETTVTATHTFAIDSTYTVELVVTDADATTDTTTVDVVVAEAPAVDAAVTVDVATGNTNTEFTFDASTSTGGTAYLWDFDSDGTYDSDTLTVATVAHTFAAAGSYTVTVMVLNDDGINDTATVDVVVTAIVPAAASFTSTGDSLYTGVEFTFDASASTGEGTLMYAWDFGDGTSGTGVTAAHTYTAEGSYTVTLVVTDSDAATDTATEVLEIILVGISDPGHMTDGYRLGQNYPNPFNPTTSIPFELKKSGHVTLSVFSITGELVATLVSGHETKGVHYVTFDASTIASGVYLYRIESEGFTSMKKMIVVK